MKVKIESSSPDGLIVTFLKGFYFNTYNEAIDFIVQVEILANELGKTIKVSDIK